MNGDPVPGEAIQVSAAARVLAVETLAPVRIADPADPGLTITDGPGFRVELDLPDRDATLDLEFGWDEEPSLASLLHAQPDIALLREWCDLDVELEVYELPWHAVRIPVPSIPGRAVRWPASWLAARLVDPLGRHLDLPSRRSLDQLLPPWQPWQP